MISHTLYNTKNQKVFGNFDLIEESSGESLERWTIIWHGLYTINCDVCLKLNSLYRKWSRNIAQFLDRNHRLCPFTISKWLEFVFVFFLQNWAIFQQHPYNTQATRNSGRVNKKWKKNIEVNPTVIASKQQILWKKMIGQRRFFEITNSFTTHLFAVGFVV